MNLDTNIVVYALASTLRREERQAMEDDPHWTISDIVLWELAQLSALGKFSFGLRDQAVQALMNRTQVLPITLNIAIEAHRLDIGRDPVDRLVAATSIIHAAPLLTRDPSILSSRLVPLALR